jgi:hypothetical protein
MRVVLRMASRLLLLASAYAVTRSPMLGIYGVLIAILAQMWSTEAE